MKVAVVGAGYVGLVSSVCLAHRGHDVTCVDAQPDIVQRLNRGEPHIHEPGLPERLSGVIAAGRFRASLDLNRALTDAAMVIIAVGTPANDDGTVDLRHVAEVARSIGTSLDEVGRFLPIVIKSTVIPGTTDTLVRGEIERASGKALGEFGLGMNPEFLREGDAIADFDDPDRIVLGHEDGETLAALEELYAPWKCEKLRVNCRTAELIKYANNAILATQISLMNEIANFSASVGDIDIGEVVRGVKLDKRWTPTTSQGRIVPGIVEYLVPGCGFGGSCLPKDVSALRAQGMARGLPMQVLSAVLQVNENQPAEVVRVLEGVMRVPGFTFLLLGLSFKPGMDDVRESASVTIAEELLARGGLVVAHDPIGVDNFSAAVGQREGLSYADDWTAAVGSADAIIVATKWKEYRDLAQMDLTGKIVFDARSLLSSRELPGAVYLSIGHRPDTTSSGGRPRPTPVSGTDVSR